MDIENNSMKSEEPLTADNDFEKLSIIEQQLKKKRDREERKLKKKLEEEENHKIRQEKAIKALNYLLTASEKYAAYYGKKLEVLENSSINARKREPEAIPTNSVAENTVKYERSWREPNYFTGQLHPYQMEGLMWLKHLYENAINGILADEMGLGKTIQVIALICHMIEEQVPGPYLIVAPLSTLPNWLNEFKRFAPKLPVILFHGSREERISKYYDITRTYKVDNYSTTPVVLTSFQVPLSETAFLQRFTWQYLIVDEGHRIKNHKCLLVQKLKSLTTLNRLLLTGTPIQNNLIELWSLLNFLLPQLFDNADTFTSLFMDEDFQVASKIIQEEQSKNILATMHGVLKPFMLRRLKVDVLNYLVPKKEVLVYCPLSQLQRDLYKWILQKNMDQLLGKEKEKENVPPEGRQKRLCTMKNKKFGKARQKEKIDESSSEIINSKYGSSLTKKDNKMFLYSVQLQNTAMLMKRVVNHPFLVHFPLEPGTTDTLLINEELVQQSGKMLVLDAMLPKLKEGGHRVLLFSTLTMVLDFVEEYLLLRDYNYCRLDGTHNLAKREKAIKEFDTNTDMFIFIISTRAGGLGLNLTAADTVILYDCDWNPQMDIQAQDRCHRIGQTKPVMVYTFVTKGTIDERILTRAKTKRRLEKIVIKKSKFTGVNDMMKSLTDLKELEELLRSVDHNLVMQSNGYVFSDEELEKLLDRTEMYNEMQRKIAN